jgi:hypothetical protein
MHVSSRRTVVKTKLLPIDVIYIVYTTTKYSVN